MYPIRTLFLAAGVAFLLAGCKTQENQQYVEKYDYIHVSKTVKGTEIDARCPKEAFCGYDASFFLPAQGALRNAMEETLTAGIYDKQAQPLVDCLVADRDSQLVDYTAQVKEVAGEGADGEVLTRWNHTTGCVGDTRGRLMEYSVKIEGYGGGAHGWYILNFFHFDTVTAKPVRLADMLLPGSEDRLNALLRESLKYREEEIDNLSAVTNNENFTIDATGLTMYYNQYEIACYAAGIVEATIAYSDFRDLVRDDWKYLWED